MAGVNSLFEAALVQHLQADASLSAVLVGVYAGVAPQAADSGVGAAFPYLLVEDVDALEYHDSDHSGFEFLLRILTYSRAPGRKQTKDIQDLLYDALHRQSASLSVAGHSVLLIDRVSSTVEDATDPDGSFEGVCDYRAIITKDAAD